MHILGLQTLQMPDERTIRECSGQRIRFRFGAQQCHFLVHAQRFGKHSAASEQYRFVGRHERTIQNAAFHRKIILSRAGGNRRGIAVGISSFIKIVCIADETAHVGKATIDAPHHGLLRHLIRQRQCVAHIRNAFQRASGSREPAHRIGRHQQQRVGDQCQHEHGKHGGGIRTNIGELQNFRNPHNRYQISQSHGKNARQRILVHGFTNRNLRKKERYNIANQSNNRHCNSHNQQWQQPILKLIRIKCSIDRMLVDSNRQYVRSIRK